MKSTLKELDKLLKETTDILGGKRKVDVVPRGFYTLEKLASEMGIAKETLRRRLDKAIRENQIEKVFFNVPAGIQIRAVPHYRKK